MFKSLQAKLIALVLTTVFISLLFSGLIFFQFLTSYTKELKGKELIEQAKYFAQIIQERRILTNQQFLKTVPCHDVPPGFECYFDKQNQHGGMVSDYSE